MEPPGTTCPLDEPASQLTKQGKARYLETINRMETGLSLGEIEEIGFSLFSYQEMLAFAVCSVKNELNEKGENANDIGTVNDPRMGTTENNRLCNTCGYPSDRCVTHFGVIDLFKNAGIMIYHPLYYDKIVQLLQAVCQDCSKPKHIFTAKQREQHMRRSAGARFRFMVESGKNVRKCPHLKSDKTPLCTGLNPVYLPKEIKDRKRVLYTDGKSTKAAVMPIEDVFRILDGISDDDAALLGFDRSAPRNLILRAILVSPPSERIMQERGGNYFPHDHTSTYNKIVKHMNKVSALRKTLATTKEAKRQTELQDEIEKEKDGILFTYEHLLNNSDNNLTQNHRKPVEGFRQLLSGKEGLARVTQGKRVQFSARTVAGPDPTLRYGQMRVPAYFASILTIPEHVTPWNIDALTKLLEKGRINYVTRKGTNEKLNIRQESLKNKVEVLEVGDLVERWLQNGDIVLLNRQPTLHKQSIMGREVVLGYERTIGLNISDTTPLNADFKLVIIE